MKATGWVFLTIQWYLHEVLSRDENKIIDKAGQRGRFMRKNKIIFVHTLLKVFNKIVILRKFSLIDNLLIMKGF